MNVHGNAVSHLGHRRRRIEQDPWNAAEVRAGLHPTLLALLAELQIVAVASDGNNDTASGAVAGVDFNPSIPRCRPSGVRGSGPFANSQLIPAPDRGVTGAICISARFILQRDTAALPPSRRWAHELAS